MMAIELGMSQWASQCYTIVRECQTGRYPRCLLSGVQPSFEGASLHTSALVIRNVIYSGARCRMHPGFITLV